MRFAQKILFLIRDANGFGPAISNSLNLTSDSNLTKSQSTFELSLESYGITNQKVSGDLINFFDQQGIPQVSILLLPNYQPPIAACAVKEVLSSVVSENHHETPTIIAPFIMRASKSNREIMKRSSPENKSTLCAAEVGPRNDFIQTMIAGISTISAPLNLECEPLACLLYMVRVLSIPTVFLIASDGEFPNKLSSNYEVEALCKVGEFLADQLGLNFSKEGLKYKQVDISRPAQEPWRALYL